jgi:hypothetical protein
MEMELGIAAVLALTAVVHNHPYKSGPGTLTVTEAGIAFEEPAKPKHSIAWNWDNIQQLELTPEKLRILTYNDSKWRAGRDREYEFTVPLSLTRIHGQLVSHLGAKYVAVFAETPANVLWQLPAKLHERLGGSEGTLYFTGDQLLYRSYERGESRSWPVSQLETIATSDAYDLTVTTLEKSGWTRGSREFRFQLKTPLHDAAYQLLWKAVNKSK